MGVLTTRAGLLQNMASGKGVTMPFLGLAPGNVTAGVAASGFMTAGFNFNALGTNQSLILPPALAGPARLTSVMMTNSQARCLYLARAYLIGTLSPTATGDRFTHDTATFPLLRTVFGAASTAITLLPMIRVTTATTTTAAIFTIKNAGSTTGYTNQAGTTVVGTKTFTMPNVATALGSAFVLRLEEGDSGVRDIASINVGTAAAAGACDVLGVELLGLLPMHLASGAAIADYVYGTLSPADLKPATATSGTVTSNLVVICVGTTTGATSLGHIQAVIDV